MNRGWLDESLLDIPGDSVTPLRQRMLGELQRRNYSSETIRGYIFAVRDLAEYYGKPPNS